MLSLSQLCFLLFAFCILPSVFCLLLFSFTCCLSHQQKQQQLPQCSSSSATSDLRGRSLCLWIRPCTLCEAHGRTGKQPSNCESKYRYMDTDEGSSKSSNRSSKKKQQHGGPRSKKLAANAENQKQTQVAKKSKAPPKQQHSSRERSSTSSNNKRSSEAETR